MNNNSTFKGAVIGDESCAGDGGNGYCNMYISKDSKWIVTGDSVITNLHCEGEIMDENGESVTIQNINGDVLFQGSGSITITVNTYHDTVDFSDAATGESFSDFEVRNPFEE